MPTLVKSGQINTGILPNQLPVVSSALKFTGTLAANGSVILTLPTGTDPTLLIADVSVLNTFSATNAPTYNWWIPGDVAITVAKSSTQIKLVNETTNAIQYTVVLR